MKCPWPALRAARALRDATAIEIDADDPAAATELAALAQANGWMFNALAPDRYLLSRA